RRRELVRAPAGGAAAGRSAHRSARIRLGLHAVPILLVPLVISAPADWGALTSAQPAPSYTYQGTVRAVNARAGTLELITGVGMSLRVVRMTTAPTTRLVDAGAASRLADLKPGDVVRAE